MLMKYYSYSFHLLVNEVTLLEYSDNGDCFWNGPLFYQMFISYTVLVLIILSLPCEILEGKAFSFLRTEPLVDLGTAYSS